MAISYKSERGRIDRGYSENWKFSDSSTSEKIEDYTKVFRDDIKLIGLYYVSYLDGHGHKRATYTPYSLRCGYGTLLFDKTGDIFKTATALRHRDPQMRTTLTYVTSNREKFRKKVVNEVFGSLDQQSSVIENIDNDQLSQPS
jgi:hypothetical protein